MVKVIITINSGYIALNEYLLMEYFIAFSSYSDRFVSGLMNITKLNNNIQQILVSLERIFGLMDNLDYNDDNNNILSIRQVAGKIEFNNVHFKFKDLSVLNDVSFRVIPNKKVAIVGKSGSGKSAMFNLLLGFYNNLVINTTN